MSGKRLEGCVLADAFVARDRNFPDEAKPVGKIIAWKDGPVELTLDPEASIPDVIELDIRGCIGY